MEECARSQQPMTCDDKQTRCTNETLTVRSDLLNENVTGYSRGCQTENKCSQKVCNNDLEDALGAVKRLSCVVNCCEGELCPKINSTDETTGGSEEASSGVESSTLNKFFLLYLALLFLLMHG